MTHQAIYFGFDQCTTKCIGSGNIWQGNVNIIGNVVGRPLTEHKGLLPG